MTEGQDKSVVDEFMRRVKKRATAYEVDDDAWDFINHQVTELAQLTTAQEAEPPSKPIFTYEMASANLDLALSKAEQRLAARGQTRVTSSWLRELFESDEPCPPWTKPRRTK
jgi:hypothetical protein